MERHPAMLWENQTDGSFLFLNGTAQNTQTPWRHHCMGAPRPHWLSQPTPDPMPRLPSTPPVSPGLMREFTPPESKVCHLDRCIYILLFQMLNLSILMRMRRIASAIKSSIQICWLMKEHSQLADTLMYILKDIFICIIKKQCSDEVERTWRQYKAYQNTINDILCQIEWKHIVDGHVAKWASMERQWFLVLHQR